MSSGPAQINRDNPNFFASLAQQQTPDYLWIGCSDSRVPANVIAGLAPGEVFVHRNVSNRVDNSDRNLLAVLQFALLHLRVKHIIVCGHYGCGGVRAAMLEDTRGPLSEWVFPIKTATLDQGCVRSDYESDEVWIDRACELNVLTQVSVIRDNNFVKEAMANQQELHLHGWIYGINNGLIHQLHEEKLSG